MEIKSDIIKLYVDELKNIYRYSPTILGKVERIEKYILNQQERIEYLERSNNRREQQIIELRDELVGEVKDAKEE